jgi:transposase
MRGLFAAAQAPGGVAAERRAACERAAFVLGDYERALAELADVGARMLATLDALELRELCQSIDGLSALGAAAILAETGDPARYSGPRAWPKHAGICPRANESGTFRGQTKVSGRGRPALRTAVWRAIWGLLPHNPVYQARYRHLTTRGANPLADGQARAALGAALLRQLFVVVTRRVPWDPAIAAGGKEVTLPQAA